MKTALLKNLQCKHRIIILGILSFFLLSVLINQKRDILKNVAGYITTSNIMEDTLMEANQTLSTTRHPLIPPYPYEYKFIINQPDKCKVKAPFLVMLVIVEGKAVAVRNAIRKTWGNESNIPGVSILRLFVTAIMSPFNTTVQDTLEEESVVYQDIIQQDFLDTYNNLTLKTLMGMEWVTKHCPSASYILKIDSDMFLNVDYLVHSLLKPEVPARKNYISGYFIPTFRVNRFKGGKYYVPKEVYAKDMYPAYVAGPAYVFSVDVAKKIYDVADYPAHPHGGCLCGDMP